MAEQDADRRDAAREDADRRHAGIARAARRGIKTTALAILASAGLATIKVAAGVMGNSYALIADGIESLLDIMSSLAVWGSLRIAARPPTKRHPYGFGKAEPLAALVVALVLVVAAAGLAIQSVREILTPHHAPEPFTLLVLVLVVAVKETMYRILSRAGKSIGSGAMQTDAWHHRSDALTSLAAFVGIAIALLGGAGYESADDWAALAACSIIAYNGVRLFRSAWDEVLDAAPPAAVIEAIRRTAAGVPQVHAIEKCHVRKSGLALFCDLHVEVDGDLTVNESHRIAHEVKDALLASNAALADVVVHIEPRGHA